MHLGLDTPGGRAFEWPKGPLPPTTGWPASLLHGRGLTTSGSELSSFVHHDGRSSTPDLGSSGRPCDCEMFGQSTTTHAMHCCVGKEPRCTENGVSAHF